MEKLTHKYTYSDVESIAKLQVKQLMEYQNSNYPLIFLDTWLIITKIWFNVVFEKEPVWLIDKIQSTKIDLFLVCDIDIPWIPDAVRENGGEKRILLHEKYIETINQFNFRYKIVKGKNYERFQNALKYVADIN